jgi:putative phosphoribosyl transferase
MQPIILKTRLQDREEAGHLLSEKLSAYKNANAVVVGISRGGICVASVIADALFLPLDVILCREIKHPANNNKNIGAVSAAAVFLAESSQTIPQDYIYHQILLLRNAMAHESNVYHGVDNPASLQYKTVILVIDVLRSSETMMACMREIKRQMPLKLIVAVPLVTAEAARVVGAEADNILFLKMEPSIESPRDYFVDFPTITEEKVIELLRSSREKSSFYE